MVVPGGQVSRRHAEIVTSPRGYMLIDTSTNGTWVNGEKVENETKTLPVANGQIVFLPGGHTRTIQASDNAVRVGVAELK